MAQSTRSSMNSSTLRVASIIIIAYAVIALVAGALLMMGVYVDVADVETEYATGVATAIGIVALIGGLLNLIVGLVGLRATKNPSRSMLALALGSVSVLFGIYGVITAIGTGDTDSIANSLTGLILPGLYLYGVIRVRKSAD